MTDSVLPPVAAQELDVSVSTIYRMIDEHKLKARKRDGLLQVDLADVARIKAERRMLAPAGITVAHGVPASCSDLLPAVNRIHLLGVQREVELRALEADALEAEQRGEMERAVTCAEVVLLLRNATYRWHPERQAWRCRIPALGERYSASLQEECADDRP